jgi:hypothetical protein
LRLLFLLELSEFLTLGAWLSTGASVASVSFAFFALSFFLDFFLGSADLGVSSG